MISVNCKENIFENSYSFLIYNFHISIHICILLVYDMPVTHMFEIASEITEDVSMEL